MKKCEDCFLKRAGFGFLVDRRSRWCGAAHPPPLPPRVSIQVYSKFRTISPTFCNRPPTFIVLAARIVDKDKNSAGTPPQVRRLREASRGRRERREPDVRGLRRRPAQLRPAAGGALALVRRLREGEEDARLSLAHPLFHTKFG
jgi:hypothetical protein